MHNNIIETICGVIVLLVAALFASMAYDIGRVKVVKGEYYSITAGFERVDGIEVGSAVKVGGVTIGRVAKASLDEHNYRAVLQFFINKNIKLPTDSTAEITSSGFLSDKYVAIIPGGETAMLGDNDAITFTQSSVSLESLLAKFVFSAQKGQNAAVEAKN